MNNDSLEKLQYKELKEKVKEFCVSGLGKNLIDELKPSANIEEVEKRLDETSEGKKLIESFRNIPLEGIYNINDIVNKLEKKIVLDPEQLVIMADFIRGCSKIKRFLRDKEEHAPVLRSYSNSIEELLYIDDEINKAIKGNKIDSSASKKLARIRRNIETTKAKIGDSLNKFLKSESNKKYIQEFFVSKRNYRYTIPIKMAYKNHVKGSIVEVSSKGATVFIEPLSVEKLSIELAALEGEEATEVYEILSTLTELLINRLDDIKVNQNIISKYDMIFAKAKYSINIKGLRPKINNNGYIKLKKCTHPLLKGEPVPLDFEIGKSYKSLIITGPNAGGKTIALKTIGLLTLAVQLGFHIQGEEETEVAVFNNIFVDIGDNQSMENSLSTFSSHMRNLSGILNKADNSTLLLFDEIGSGTEPNEGAALAISLLEEFYKRGCNTVATTHYGEIKNFSERRKGFKNAAMQFRNETLEPLYKLVIGESGNSNAMWIARKMGIKDEIIKRAVSYIG